MKFLTLATLCLLATEINSILVKHDESDHQLKTNDHELYAHLPPRPLPRPRHDENDHELYTHLPPRPLPRPPRHDEKDHEVYVTPLNKDTNWKIKLKDTLILYFLL